MAMEVTGRFVWEALSETAALALAPAALATHTVELDARKHMGLATRLSEMLQAIVVRGALFELRRGRGEGSLLL